MTEKITNLIEELAAECAKEKVALVCAATDKDKVQSVCGGELETLVLLMSKMIYKLEKETEIPWEILKIRAFASEKKEQQKPEHTFFVENESELKDALSRIFRGDFQ